MLHILDLETPEMIQEEEEQFRLDLANKINTTKTGLLEVKKELEEEDEKEQQLAAAQKKRKGKQKKRKHESCICVGEIQQQPDLDLRRHGRDGDGLKARGQFKIYYKTIVQGQDSKGQGSKGQGSKGQDFTSPTSSQLDMKRYRIDERSVLWHQ